MNTLIVQKCQIFNIITVFTGLSDRFCNSALYFKIIYRNIFRKSESFEF